MRLLISVSNLRKSVVYATRCPFQHRVLYLELVLVGDLTCEVRTTAEMRADDDLHLLERQDDADVRPHTEELRLGGLYLSGVSGTLKGAEQLLEGLEMMKEACNLSSLLGVNVR